MYLFHSLSSNDKTIKELRDRLLRTRGHPQLDQISDINVICGVVKDFLRSLREPLLTFALHETFINAACKSLVKRIFICVNTSAVLLLLHTV